MKAPTRSPPTEIQLSEPAPSVRPIAVFATTFTPLIVPSTARRTRTAAGSPISPAASMAPVAAAEAASSAVMATSPASLIAPSPAPPPAPGGAGAVADVGPAGRWGGAGVGLGSPDASSPRRTDLGRAGHDADEGR